MNLLIDRLAQTVRDSGGRLLMVGGCVRDRFLGLTSKDTDCEVFGIAPDALRTLLEQFGSVNTVGASFGVYKLDNLDISIPRRDSKSGTGHKGFVIEGDPTMSYEDAARRRDFTMNAVSFDPLTQEYIDPFGGIADIKNKVLRVVDFDRFGDDSLRVLRAVQFAARFGFMLEPASFALCASINLTDLPAERVWGEFDKLLHADRPSIGLNLALDLGVVQSLWPELAALVGVQQDTEWHPEGDVWVHTLQVVDYARYAAVMESSEKQTTVMLAALCHDFGKATTTAFLDGRWRALGHEEAGVTPTTSFLARLNVQTINNYDVRANVLALVEHHLRPFEWYKVDPGDSSFRRLSRKVDLLLLARVAAADTGGRWPRLPNHDAVLWFLDRVSALDLREPIKPLLMGRHLLALGMKPGPRMGELLKLVFEKQLDGSVTVVDEAVDEAKRLLDAVTWYTAADYCQNKDGIRDKVKADKL
jgi:tRNA nucleotidyltransferase (CCA-adding enzyme)